jgi:hypothetical protein
MRAARHQNRVKNPLRLREAEISDHPHAVGTAQRLCVTRHQDAIVTILFRQKTIRCGKYIEWTCDVERLYALVDD